MDEKTVRAIFAEYVAELEKDFKRETPTILGLDEIYLSTPRGVITNIGDRCLVDTRFGNNITEDVWRHEHNWSAEICTLAMCLNRVGDPQKLQDRMRELGNINARLVKRNQDLSKRNETLSWENYLLRNPGDQHQTATPRKIAASPAEPPVSTSDAIEGLTEELE